MPVIMFSALYALGIPIFYMYLLYKFEARGKAGDTRVQGALAWPVESSADHTFPD